MLPRLTPKQRQRANALIKRLCANYDNGNCLALDDGEPCACVQSIFAKLGSDMKKPDAVTVIPKDSFQEKIWGLPAADLLGVGRATQRVLDMTLQPFWWMRCFILS